MDIGAMTYDDVHEIKAKFAAVWKALRAKPLPTATIDDLAQSSGIQIVCAAAGGTTIWTEFRDPDDRLDPVVARRVLGMRHHLRVDSKARVIVFIDADLTFYEIAEIGPAGVGKPYLRANLPSRSDPKRAARRN